MNDAEMLERVLACEEDFRLMTIEDKLLQFAARYIKAQHATMGAMEQATAEALASYYENHTSFTYIGHEIRRDWREMLKTVSGES